MGWVGVVTNEGNAMLAQLAGGSHTMTITKATIGTGSRAEINLRSATALVSEVGDVSIANKEEVTGGVKLRIRVTPGATAYTAHEIGIWAKIDSGTAKLLSIHQDAATGVDVPTAATSPEFVFDLIVALAISNTSSLTITIDPDVYATMDDIADALEDYVAIDQGIGNAGKWMKVGNDGKLSPENLPAAEDASTSQKGVVMLSNAVDSESETKAATPKALKTAYDLANGKANKSTAVSITALANGWSNAEPSTQSIAVAGMTSATKFLIGAGALTQTQLEAMIAGLIQCTAQGSGSITLTCYGDVPEIDLPVQIVIVD